MTMPFGADDADRDYFEPDEHRHCTPEAPCGHRRAEASWAQTLAATDGDAGVSIWTRAELDEWAYDGDFEEVW